MDNKAIIDQTLRYLGHAHFDIYDSGNKIVITLSNGDTHWFLYSYRMDERNLVGEIVCWLMNRTTDPSPALPDQE